MEYDSPGQASEGPKAKAETDPIASHIERLFKRRQGYSFRGPDAGWCLPPDPAPPGDVGEGRSLTRMLLPVDPSAPEGREVGFSGCRKYATCELIPDDARWVSWERLTARQREKLKDAKCYRATRQRWNPDTKTLEESSWSGWDVNALPSRQGRGPNANWIGNPFGVRTTGLGSIARKAREKGLDAGLHRDLSPCPVGGCVTPEMQRDYMWERAGDNVDWARVEACPFYFRHTTSDLTAVVPNLQRFTQCYVMLDWIRDDNKSRLIKSGVRRALEQAGIIVAAPVFRSLADKAGVSETFWYSFFSGFSYIQLPVGDIEAFARRELEHAFRWQATSISRQATPSRDKSQSILKLFDSVETGKELLEWETDERLLSVSEGISSCQLLSWILIQRLRAAIKLAGENDSELNIYDELEWEYAKSEANNDLLPTLRAMGYDVEKNFKFEERDGYFYRRSSLAEDLCMLGLVDGDGSPTMRLECGVMWVHARLRDPNAVGDGRLSEIKELLEPGLEFFQRCLDPDRSSEKAANLCLGLLVATICRECIRAPEGAPLENLRRISVTDAPNLQAHLDAREKRIETVSRLNPRVHILVRAYSPVPVRWMFLPMWERMDGSPTAGEMPRTKSQSGIILLLVDELDSVSYHPEWESTRADSVLNRLRSVYPLLDATFRIEESLIRESLVSVKEWWDEQRDQAASMQHYIKDVRNELKRFERVEGFAQVYHLLTYLDSYFRLPPEKEAVKANPPVAIDVARVAKEAVAERTVFHKISESKVKISFECEEDEAVALLTPLDSRYEEEEDQKVVSRAQGGVILFLNDLLIQREAHGARQMVLRVSLTPDLVLVEVRTQRAFDKRFLWDSRSQDISRWPVGRGWYATFSFAKALGSVWQTIANEGGGGLIRIAFRRGKS
jgi:hypothetical protein